MSLSYICFITLFRNPIIYKKKFSHLKLCKFPLRMKFYIPNMLMLLLFQYVSAGITPHGLVHRYQHFAEHTVSIFNPEYEKR
jgi:hypothetical protein